MLSDNLKKYITGVDARDDSSAYRRKLYGLFIDIALAITTMREERGISKREMAKLLNTSHPTVVRWETPGYTGYNLAKLVDIADVLNHSVELRFVPKEVISTVVANIGSNSWNNTTISTKVNHELEDRNRFNVISVINMGDTI